MTLTPEDVARLREKATPGKWWAGVDTFYDPHKALIHSASWGAFASVCVTIDGKASEEGEANAAFIAAAHDMADLIASQAQVMDRMAMDLTWIKNHTYADIEIIRQVAENSLTTYYAARGQK